MLNLRRVDFEGRLLCWYFCASISALFTSIEGCQGDGIVLEPFQVGQLRDPYDRRSEMEAGIEATFSE
jgi:hypothetical protein